MEPRNLGSTFQATNANDGNVTTYWEGLSYPNLLTVDLGSAQNVSIVRIKLNPAWPARIQTLSVLGSTDNLNYTTIVGSASYNFAPAKGTVSFKWDSGTTPRPTATSLPTATPAPTATLYPGILFIFKCLLL